MDKETISTYGFILVSAMLLSVLLALVTPIGESLGFDITDKTKTLVYNTGVMDADNNREYGTVIIHYQKEGQTTDFKTYKTSARMNEKCYIEIPSIQGYEPTYDSSVILATGNTMNQVVVDSSLKEIKVTYRPIEYSIRYVLNSGTLSGSYPTAYTYGSFAFLPDDSQVTREGYKFVGWFEDSGLGGERVYSIKTDTYGNKTYYAKYAVN